MMNNLQSDAHETGEVRVIAIAVIALVVLVVSSVTIAISSYRAQNPAHAQVPAAHALADHSAPVRRD